MKISLKNRNRRRKGKLLKFAIYGFFFNKAFSFNGFNFIPKKHDLLFWDEVKVSKCKRSYYLTGYIETPDLKEEKFIFTMQAVLTFVQQQDVILKLIIQSELPEYIECEFERRGNPAPFAMYFELQKEIVQKLYNKFSDKTDKCNLTGNNYVFDDVHNAEFKSLVFKVTEPFHMRKDFIEVTHFLYFSGLEAFCKQYLKSYFPEIIIAKDSAINIAQLMEKMEISYVHLNSSNSRYNLRNNSLSKTDFLKLSLSTYTNLRNKLFHENLFIAETECSNIKNAKGKYPKEEVKITDYEYYLLRLCNVVILKYIGIESKQLNCNKWYTRFPLIKDIYEGEK